jgi:site-specific DNA recombinase
MERGKMMIIGDRKIKKVAIFIRISDEKKVMGKRVSADETLKNHKEILIGYCDRNKLKYELFTEIISGGTEDINDRTALKDMLDNLHKFDAILVTELSRLSRDSLISATIKRYVTKYKKLILTPEANYDLNNPSDALMYDVGNAVAVHERTVIGKRIKNNKLSLAKQGLNASGSAPLGYFRNPKTKKLEIDLDTAHIVSTAFYLCYHGWGSVKIQQYFNQSGYKTKMGKSFTKRAVQDLLMKETYKGFTVYHDIEKEMVEDLKTGEVIQKRKIKDTITVPKTHPAIVAPEIFDAVQVIRAKRGEISAGSGRNKPSNNPSMLKDLLYCNCEKCKRKMRIVYDKDVHMIKACTDVLSDGSKCNNSGFKIDKVEGMVLKDIFSFEKQIKAEISQLETSNLEQIAKEKESLKINLEKQLKQLDKEAEQFANMKIQLLMDGAANNDIMEKVIQEKIEANFTSRKNVQKQLDQVIKELEKPTVKKEIQKREMMLTTIEKFEKENDLEKMNNLLKQFIYKIHYKRVLPEDIKQLGYKNPIRMNYLPEIEIEYL